MYFPDIEGRKYKDENENIVNAQTPLHQVSTQVFKAGLAIFNPHKNEKTKSQGYPKESSIKPGEWYDFVFLLNKPKSKVSARTRRIPKQGRRSGHRHAGWIRCKISNKRLRVRLSPSTISL
jgi:hypothetical protein